MKTTSEYFNVPLWDLVETDDYTYTKEERLLFDDGLEIVFFDDGKEMNEEMKGLKEYMRLYNYEIKTILKTVNERIAIVLI